MSHELKMIIGCVLPLLLLFVLPALGVSDDVTLFIFIVLMFGCHLFMMRGHGHDRERGCHGVDGHSNGSRNGGN